MSGLKQATRWRAMRARFRRRISSSLLPENMGPVMTSMRPASRRAGAGELGATWFVDAEGFNGEVFTERMPLRWRWRIETCVSKHPTRNPAVDFAYLIHARSHAHPGASRLEPLLV